ncbi:MAG: hypothetical protein E7159_03360 [Firmicutes bacterium]|jgi:hypothetical protein|nr:hypothetical protein [Bacillota bacterium]
MLLLGISFEDIADAAINFFILIGIHINAMIYNIATFLFDIFISIISATIFNTEDFEKIANSVYLVIGVVALFIVSYALLRAIVDPDGASKSNYAVKKIVPNILIAVILIAFVPFIFSNAYKLQSAVVRSNIIPNVVFGRNLNGVNATDGDCNPKDGSNCTSSEYVEYSGRMMANDVFLAFFVPTQPISGSGQTYSDNLKNYYDSLTITNCWLFFCDGNTLSFGEAQNKVAKGEEGFGIYAEFADWMHGKDSAKNKLEYNWLLQLISGVILVYVLVNFCIDMAVRVVKLGYFQIIAPIPILTIMIPGQKKIFDNWMKQSIQTFLDVFLRIFIIFMGILLINMLPELGDDLWTNSLSPTHPNIARAFIMIGILIFMKQAPKLIADIFGISSGSFKLGIADKLGEMALVGDQAKNLVNSTGGALTGALGAGWTSRRNGMGWKEGMKYGFSKGWKTKNPHQFSAMRQDFYSGAMQGEGKAAFFTSGRSYFDKVGAKWQKDAKNAYKKENFNRVLRYQQSDDWKNLYENKYNETRANITADRNKASIKLEHFDHQIAAAEAHQQTYNTVSRIYEREKEKFETEKTDRINELKMRYERATELGDISQQLSLQSEIDDIKSQKYSNKQLEDRLRQLKETMIDIDSIKSNPEIGRLREEIKGYNDSLASLHSEYEYVMSNNRTYDTDKKFYKDHGGFSDLYDKVNAEFKEGSYVYTDAEGNEVRGTSNPDYKDVYDTHAKNLRREETDAYINSSDGQKQIAALQQAQKNLQSAAPKDDKK